MTRKRFVKLLMSTGVQRHAADQYARSLNMPYKQAWPIVRVSRVVAMFSIALSRTATTIAAAGRAFSEFSAAAKVAMEKYD